MAIEVEDGTGKTNAVSYLSVADATAYHAARGNDAWADVGDAAVQEAALVRATFAIDSWLRGCWRGVKKTAAQSLAWPRLAARDSTTGVTDEDGYELSTSAVPLVVKHACAEVALIEITERFIQQEVSSGNTVASETVGPISVSYRADSPTNKRYPHVEALLRGIANVAGTQIGMNIYLTDDEIEDLDGSSGFDPFDYASYFNLIKNY